MLIYLTPPSSTASSAEAAARSSITGIFALFSLMYRCWNIGKISHWCGYWSLVVLLFLLFLLLSIGFIIVWSVAFSPTVFTIIKTRPHIMAAFSNGAHMSQKTEVDADCIRKEHAEIPALCYICHWNKSGTLISRVNQIHSSSVGELFIEF